MSSESSSCVLYLVEERPTMSFFEQAIQLAVGGASSRTDALGTEAPDACELLSRIATLQSAGFVCKVGSTRADPIAQVLATSPALIILDVVGYKRDTRRLQRDLKQHPGTRDVPLIIITNDGRSRSRVRAAEIGFQSYLVKPARPTELYAEIRRLGVSVRRFGNRMDGLDIAST